MKGDQRNWAGAIADFNEAEQIKPLEDHSLEQRDDAMRNLGMHRC